MILLRHAECYQDYENDPHLTKFGIDKIRQFSKILKKLDIKEIFCSTKKRCEQTAKILINILGLCNSQSYEILKEIHPDTLCEISPLISSDYLRANIVYEYLIIPNINKKIVIISHQNLLLFIFKRIDNSLCINPFEEYFSGVILTTNEQGIIWKPLFIC